MLTELEDLGRQTEQGEKDKESVWQKEKTGLLASLQHLQTELKTIQREHSNLKAEKKEQQELAAIQIKQLVAKMNTRR